MKQQKRQFAMVTALLLATLIMTACSRKTEEMKVEETVAAFMTGYSTNNSAQMMNVISIDESNKDEFEAVLEQFLQLMHQESYSVKLDYTVSQIQVVENQAKLQISAIIRIYENGAELISFRLLNNQQLYLVKDAYGEWKIDFKQYFPADLLPTIVF